MFELLVLTKIGHVFAILFESLHAYCAGIMPFKYRSTMYTNCTHTNCVSTICIHSYYSRSCHQRPCFCQTKKSLAESRWQKVGGHSNGFLL